MEGLTKHWGLFLSTYLDDPSNSSAASIDRRRVGSDVFGNAFGAAPPDPRRILARLPPPNFPGFRAWVETNSQSIQDDGKRILLAYLFVFHEYLVQYSSAGIDAKSAMIRWVQYQALHSDWFCDILVGLKGSPANTLTRLIRAEWQAIRVIIGEQRLFVVVDRAEFALQYLPDALRTANGTRLSVLTEFVRVVLNELDERTTIIVAGTHVPREHFQGAEFSTFRWSSNTGCFEDPGALQRYVGRVLPPSLLASRSGDLLGRRMWRWFKHRCAKLGFLIGRFSQMLVDMVSPLASLNSYFPTGLSPLMQIFGNTFSL